MKASPWFASFMAFTLFPIAARAWDQKGHRTVAAIAWDRMDATTRTRAAAILRGASPDSSLLDGDSAPGLTQEARERALFLRAAT